MKNKILFFIILTTVLVIGSTNVDAKSAYWEKKLNNEKGELIPNASSSHGCGIAGNIGITEWANITQEYIIDPMGGCGDYSDKYPQYYPSNYTMNIVFNDVTNLKIKSSNEDIVTATYKKYDFAKEKKAYEDYIKDYNALTLEKLNDNYYCREYKEDCYTTKPTWWEYSGYTKEPTTWWETYGFKEEPKNAVEVISHAKDLGKAKLTLSADGKDDITIDWKISAWNFNEPQGLVEILENPKKYADVIPERSTHDWGELEEESLKANFVYELSKKDDLSEVINALKGKDYTILFKGYNSGITSTYLLNGLEIKNTVNKGFTYNHKISMETSINKDNFDSLGELKDALYIDFDYHGNLPTEYKLKVNIKDYIRGLYYEKKYKELACETIKFTDKDGNVIDKEAEKKHDECSGKAGKYADEKMEEYMKDTTFSLIYYNPDTDKLELINTNLKADKDGIIELTFDHFSSYAVVRNGDYSISNVRKVVNKPKDSADKDAKNNAQTSSMNVGLSLIIMFIAIVGIIALSLKKKNI